MYLRVFEELFGLRVILGFDLLVVYEVLFLALVVVDLEPVAVQSVVTLLAADILNDYIVGDEWTVVIRLGSPGWTQ
jgi:hypothetical protein